MKVGIVQQSNSEDHELNLNVSLAHIKQLADQGADLIVLQELHRSIYFCQSESPRNLDLAEPLNGPTAEAFANTASSNHFVIAV